MTTPHIPFTFLEQLFSFKLTTRVKISHAVIEKTTYNSPSVNKTLLKFGYKIATLAIYVYCRLKIVQEQAQSMIEY